MKITDLNPTAHEDATRTNGDGILTRGTNQSEAVVHKNNSDHIKNFAQQT